MKKLARTLLDKLVKSNGGRVFRWLMVKCPPVCYVWLLISSPSMRREMRQVASGMAEYYKEGFINRYELRRSIHRLEKGLTMRPRRLSFASDYIGDVVKAFTQSKEGKGIELDHIEYKWASDVLNEYFDVIEAKGAIANAKREYLEELGNNCKKDQGITNHVPFSRSHKHHKPAISYTDLLALAKWRRSVRWFQKRFVPRMLVEQAVEIAAFSPSACNRLPYHFRVIDDPNLVRAVAEIPGGTKGYAENIPGIIVVLGDLSAFASTRDRHLIYIDSCLASMSLIYAFETLGISTCCINWRGSDSGERRMRQLLKIKEHDAIIMLIAYGYEDELGLVAYSGKRSTSKLTTFNNEN